MRTRKLTRFTSAIAAIGLLATAAAPALAAPVPSSTATLTSAIASPVTQVRWRGYGWRGYGWRGYGWRGYGWRRGAVVGGLVLGGVIASQAYRYRGPVYYGPTGYYGPGYNDWLAYCSSRYRSFDPASGTYMGYDGHRHSCR